MHSLNDTSDRSLALICLLAIGISPFPQATQHAYAQQHPDVLRSLFKHADSRSDSLLIRYRLYPLTEEAAPLDGIPTSLNEGTPREYALLSGLWAFRAGEASVLSAMQYGRRSVRLLEQAKSRDPDAPFVLLVEGQSLLFRPSIAGGDPAAAAERFAHLARTVDEEGTCGISRNEARVWHWLALREADQLEKAKNLRRTLRQRKLAPLYEQFLNDPPEV